MKLETAKDRIRQGAAMERGAEPFAEYSFIQALATWAIDQEQKLDALQSAHESLIDTIMSAAALELPYAQVYPRLVEILTATCPPGHLDIYLKRETTAKEHLEKILEAWDNEVAVDISSKLETALNDAREATR